MLRISAVLLTLAISACSSVEQRRLANGDFKYLDEPEANSLQVPSDLDTPNFSNTYVLPELGENSESELLGEKISITSPALVLPLVTGSHIEEGIKQATVYFDQVDDSQPLDTTIWNSLINFLEEQGIGVDSFDKEQQRLVTDWMIIESDEDTPWYSWTKTDRSVGRRFEFWLDVKPHGRTAALNTKLKDYLETKGENVISEIDSEAVRRNEVDVLNQVIGHYAGQIRVAEVKRIQEIRKGLDMELGFDADGEPAFVVDAEYQVAWPRLLLVLRKLGFNVKDLDQSTGLLFVNYGGGDVSWWERLWTRSGELLLDEDEYRLQVRELGAKTSITLLDDESQPFTVDQVTSLFQPFSDTMSSDNLDI